MALNRQFGLLPEHGNQRGSTLHGFELGAGECIDLADGMQAEIRQFALLQVSPDVFGGI